MSLNQPQASLHNLSKYNFANLKVKKLHWTVTHYILRYILEKNLIALDQNDSPVPTTVLQMIDNNYAPLMDEGDKYRLSPSRKFINSRFCTDVTYKLYSAYEDTQVDFKLYHKNPCQNLVRGLSLGIFIKSCPLGFELTETEQLMLLSQKTPKIHTQMQHRQINSNYRTRNE
jgi:hypothetical protein